MRHPVFQPSRNYTGLWSMIVSHFFAKNVGDGAKDTSEPSKEKTVQAGWQLWAINWDNHNLEVIAVKKRAFLKSTSADGYWVNQGEDSKSNTFRRDQKGLLKPVVGCWIKKLLSKFRHLWEQVIQSWQMCRYSCGYFVFAGNIIQILYTQKPHFV